MNGLQLAALDTLQDGLARDAECLPGLGYSQPAGRGLLAELRSRDDVILSLVTGNLEAIAKVKLARARLKSFFSPWQGGFGSDSDDRTDLPAIARERAGALSGEGPYPRERTIVIGDTARDIACARADGLRCIAVTTGPHGAKDLATADAVAKDVAHLRELLLRSG